jgi:hypothetical protein
MSNIKYISYLTYSGNSGYDGTCLEFSSLFSQILWNKPDHLKSTALISKDRSMFKHQIQIQLKTGSLPLLSQKIKNTILPLLLEQKGCCDSRVIMTREHTTATEGIFWKTREDAEASQRSVSPNVFEVISEVAVKSPVVGISEVSAQS